MIITDSAWVEIATNSGALVQKFGSGFISLSYATVTPTTEPKFALTGHTPLLMPAITGKNLYAKSTKGDVSLSVEAEV